MTEDFVITDGQGRPAAIRLQMDNALFSVLSRGLVHAPGHFTASWRALTLGALGAQSGGVRILPGTYADPPINIWRSFDLALTAQMHRGVSQTLIVLKRWLVNNRREGQGTGTLVSGVNLGLHSGEIAWSASFSRRH